MADQKKTPEPFKADLFASPGSTGLSFGLGNEVFSSPFSLAPALTSASHVTASPKPDGKLQCDALHMGILLLV